MTNASQIGLLQVLRPCLITINYSYVYNDITTRLLII